MKHAWTALLLCCPLAGLADEHFLPVSEQGASLQPAVEWALQHAPRDWIRLRLTYGYRDAFAKVRVDVMGPHTRRWRMAPMEEDPSIYGFFDGWVATQPMMQKPGSGVTVMVDRSTRRYAVVYCAAAMEGDAGQGGFVLRVC